MLDVFHDEPVGVLVARPPACRAVPHRLHPRRPQRVQLPSRSVEVVHGDGERRGLERLSRRGTARDHQDREGRRADLNKAQASLREVKAQDILAPRQPLVERDRRVQTVRVDEERVKLSMIETATGGRS